jgi:hypothetical protein
MKTKALSRDDRKNQIMLAFAIEIQSDRTGEMTIADIAKKLHLTASTKLRDMVMELVIEGSLDFRDETIPGIAKYRRIYSGQLKKDKIHISKEPKKRTALKVNSAQGQLMLDWGQS